MCCLGGLWVFSIVNTYVVIFQDQTPTRVKFFGARIQKKLICQNRQKWLSYPVIKVYGDNLLWLHAVNSRLGLKL